MRTWIRSPLCVFDGFREISASDLVVEDNRIVEILAPAAPTPKDIDSVVDASDQVLVPGLINTHHHFYQTLTRSVDCALDKALFPWLQALYPVWAGLTAEMVDVATRLACSELLLSGCTTSADHHYLFTDRCPNALDVQVEAVRSTGIRSVLTRGSMSLGKGQGGLPPDNTIQGIDEILADSERVIDAYHDPRPESMLRIALAPCSPFSVTRELMIDTAQLGTDRSVMLHTHLAETRDENRFCLEKYGCRPLEYLEQTGWLRKGTWLAHGIHFEQAEIDALGKHGVGVAHCPTSNMMLGSGHCPVIPLQLAGGRIGLGVDGSASNDCSNMIQEVRQAFLLHRLHYGAGEFGHEQAMRLATSGSADCLGWPQIGRLEVGSLADIALFSLDELRFSGSGNPLAALVLCGAHRASDVMVDGVWRVRDGELVDGNLAELRIRHRRLSAEIQRRGV